MFDPGTDPVLEALASFLQQRVNQFQAGAIVSSRALTGANLSSFLLDTMPLTAYPMLALHQESARGESLEQAVCGMEYLVPITMQSKAFSLTWMQKAIARALCEYTEPSGLQILKNPAEMSARSTIIGRGQGVFLSLNIRFEYWDRAVV